MTTREIVMHPSVSPLHSGHGWGWYWGVTNPSGLLGERNFVGQGKALTRRGAVRKANRCARREVRRLRRADARRAKAGYSTIRAPR